MQRQEKREEGGAGTVFMVYVRIDRVEGLVGWGGRGYEKGA